MTNNIEGLWVIEFSIDLTQWQNGGILVLETQKILGGNSKYYYVGEYHIFEGKLIANARIQHHSGLPYTAFGDNSKDFNITLKEAKRDQNNYIEGLLVREGFPGKLHFRMKFITPLP